MSVFDYITFICKTSLLPLRTTSDYTNYTLDSWNFSKGEEILFANIREFFVTVTEINVLRLFYTCHFCTTVKFLIPK